MKKLFIGLSLIALLCSACGGTVLNVLDIDQMQPSTITYPEGLRRIAVVDRMSMQAKDEPANPLAVDSKSYCEELAQLLADANYFDEVIICDSDVSTLNRKDGYIYPLSQENVQTLAQALNVDAILGLEMSSASLVNSPTLGVFAKTSSVARLYIPTRKQPVQSILNTDSIYWDAYSGGLALTDMREDAKSYIVEKIAHQLTPYWKSVQRCYYDGGSVDMRDAGVFVRKGDWAKAEELWAKALATAAGRSRIQLKYNLIVATELKGDIDKALQDCSALETEALSFPNENKMVVYYQSVLKKRADDMSRLQLQMHRFE